MSDNLARMLCMHSSPAICGIKASNLVSFDTNEMNNIEEEIEELNNLYSKKICFKILQHKDNRILVLIYKNQVMDKTLNNFENKEFLKSLNYNTNSTDSMIETLQDRINASSSFPHEIGVFLGYDLSDTIEFLKGNKKCIYVGYWKVYSKLEEKKAIFDRYNMCKDRLMKLINKGYPLENFLK